MRLNDFTPILIAYDFYFSFYLMIFLTALMRPNA